MSCIDVIIALKYDIEQISHFLGLSVKVILVLKNIVYKNEHKLCTKSLAYIKFVKSSLVYDKFKEKNQNRNKQ